MNMHGDVSRLMSAYNYARHFARRTGVYEVKRVDRAWGYIMSGKLKEKASDYGAEFDRCSCPDASRGFTCKHSIGLMIVAKAEQLKREDEERWDKLTS